MPEEKRATIRLRDYAPPPFLIDRVALDVRLGEEETRVTGTLAFRRNGDGDTPLVLDGVDLDLQRISLDGEDLGENRYDLDGASLTIIDPPDQGVIETEVRIRPQENTSLEGLYRSSGNFCTQCEAEGFRKITFFPDRPDVMSRYKTRIEADRDRYPVLLSNGNLVDHGEVGNGCHYAVWEDPFAKPSYLFALVAGNLAQVSDSFRTRSGRDVALRIYVEPGNEDRCAHAMASLKKAMAWDEERYGREYDLDTFMIVAVSDFNMGAMENKGLNIFNSKYVLAKPETATDMDYDGIESVIAHEYFHNWTGNRVTCRDWFQLTLKEGLTVFRDQQFSADMRSRAVRRIQEVKRLRAAQFPEDSGPLAHPIQPQQYVEINNFYTATVYEKGAEVIRMIHTLLGEEGFRKGMDLYFERHDGQAVTTEEFVSAMEDASGVDLEQFRNWYVQAGTPVLTCRGHHDAEARTYTLEVSQSIANETVKDRHTLHVPLAIGLLDRDGQDLPLCLDGETWSEAEAPRSRVLNVREPDQKFVFRNINEPPVPSLLRDFSAPVRIEQDPDEAHLLLRLEHDSDTFNRWEAGQTLATRLILDLIADIQAARPLAMRDSFREAFATVLADEAVDDALKAATLTLPSSMNIAQQMDVIDVEAIDEARQFVRRELAEASETELERIYRSRQENTPPAFKAEYVARRHLKNVCLGYLAARDERRAARLCVAQYEASECMTDSIAALSHLADMSGPEHDKILADFYDRWQNDQLVIDKWFSLQALSRRDEALDDIRGLFRHPAYNLRNPNRVRALIGAFSNGNQLRFHDPSGDGYQLLADQILELDGRNPMIAARLIAPLGQWRRHDETRRRKMRATLEAIVGKDGISNDVFEMATRSLS